MSDNEERGVEDTTKEGVPDLEAERDKKFLEERDILLQEINSTMDSILNGLNSLNISLEGGVAVGKEFQSVSDLWKSFYDGMESMASDDL